MGLIMTMLVLALTYASPAEVFPELSVYRPVIVTTALAVFASLVNVARVPIKTPPFWLLIGFLAMCMISRIGSGWLGGAFDAIFTLQIFAIPSLLLVMNMQSLRAVRWAMGGMVAIGAALCAQGLAAYYLGINYDKFVLQQALWGPNDQLLGYLERVMAAGFLADPNDFAQFLVSLLPLLFCFWSQGAVRRVMVLGLAAVFALTIYTTNSRGALIGVAIIILFAMRKRFGNWVAIVGVAGVVAVATLTGFGGGREVSINESSSRGRIESWSAGLSMLKDSPIWGIGYNQYLKYSELTAHNSFVLCFAETGLVGYFFWLCLIFVIVLYLNVLTEPDPRDPISVETAHLASAVRLSFFGFLATGWFLSRTYDLTFYVLVAFAIALTELERKRGNRRLVIWKLAWVPSVLGLEAASITAFWVLMRIR